MTVICADPSSIALFSLKRKIDSIIPDARIFLCKKTETAIQIARQEGCNVLITEIDFGREKDEGIRLAEQIRRMFSKANVIFATAASNNDYAAMIIKMKFSGYLTKPYETEELKKELHELRFR